MGGPVPTEEPGWLHSAFPLRFVGASHALTLVAGFALILVAAHLWAQKRRAWQFSLVLVRASTGFHLAKGWGVEQALCSLGILAALWFSREVFAIGSGRPQVRAAVFRAASAFGIAALYGAVGFWLLEPAEFHRNFHWWDAALRTIRLMLFLGDQSLVPHTPYAAWFLDSLFWMSAAAFLYSGLVLFRPVVYRFQASRSESEAARAIAERYGRTGQDFFKHWPDKSYFFSSNRNAFLAYRVAGNYALVLGDPVGPETELRATVDQFTDFCRKRGWRVGFHQVSGDHLHIYEALGFHRLKVGDDAIVDVAGFALAGSAMKEVRNTVNRLDRLGYRVERIDPPLTGPLLADLRRISDQWLKIPGHRERQFTLGRFEASYVQATPVYVAFDLNHQAVAFLNLVPSYEPSLATVDLMRRSPDSVNGIMDFLFAKVFLDLKPRGIRHFSLGMAPLAGVDGQSTAGLDERLVRWVFKLMPSLFRTDSLRRFKAKFADSWTPRYTMYQSRLDVPRLALALRRICELPAEEMGNAA